MTLRSVVFDLDGTLTHFNIKTRDAKIAFLRRIREMGINSRFLTLDRPVEILLRYLEKSHGLDRDFLLKIADECFSPYEVEAAERAELKPEARAILGKLKTLGYKLGIASNNCRECIEIVLRKFELVDFFNEVVTRNDVKRLKPHEEMLFEVMRRLKVKPWETVYVGDSIADVVAGKRAGTFVVAIENKHSVTRLPAKIYPDFVIENLNELTGVIKLLEERSF